MDKQVHLMIYDRYNYVYIIELKLILVKDFLMKDSNINICYTQYHANDLVMHDTRATAS